MILKARDESDFNLSMKLIVNYEPEYIEIIVSAWNKKAHTKTMKQFHANKFSDALAYYRQQEAFLFGNKEEHL